MRAEAFNKNKADDFVIESRIERRQIDDDLTAKRRRRYLNDRTRTRVYHDSEETGDEKASEESNESTLMAGRTRNRLRQQTTSAEAGRM